MVVTWCPLSIAHLHALPLAYNRLLLHLYLPPPLSPTAVCSLIWTSSSHYPSKHCYHPSSPAPSDPSSCLPPPPLTKVAAVLLSTTAPAPSVCHKSPCFSRQEEHSQLCHHDNNPLQAASETRPNSNQGGWGINSDLHDILLRTPVVPNINGWEWIKMWRTGWKSIKKGWKYEKNFKCRWQCTFFYIWSKFWNLV